MSDSGLLGKLISEGRMNDNQGSGGWFEQLKQLAILKFYTYLCVLIAVVSEFNMYIYI